MFWRLYKVELFKLVRRPAARITILIFAALAISSSAFMYYNSQTNVNIYFGFPNAWDFIFNLTSAPVSIFASVLVILLVANEFDWRTSRQNIIDGLSRREWFTAKIALLPTVVMLLYLPLLLYDVTLAWLGTDPSINNAFEITRIQYLACIGTLIGVLGYASIAMVFAMLARTAGAALGITILYPFLEDRISKTVAGFGHQNLADCFPVKVIGALFNYSQYYPEGTVRRGWTVAEWDTPVLFAAGIGWIIVFLIASWLAYYKRDL